MNEKIYIVDSTLRDGEQSPGTVAVIPIDYFYELINKVS